jgi:hypothetical protein
MTRKSRISENEIVRKAFREAYSTRVRGESHEGWRSQVMGQIRRIGPLAPTAGFWPAFEHIVWRLAPVSCLLVLVFAAFFLNMDFDFAYDYLDTIRAELEKPALVELFGIEG